MSISVWADIGGTFTDCLVCNGLGRREIKVLSSGLVRARAYPLSDPRQLRLGSCPGVGGHPFWVGARAWLLKANGERLALGMVASQRQSQLEFDRKIVHRFDGADSPEIIELVAGVEAPVLAARLLLDVPLSQPLPPLDVRLGTTRGTNALLTRSGAPTALLVTEGFGDLLRIGEQDRPDLFSLTVNKHAPLTEHVIEVRGRMDAAGNILQPLDLKRLEDDLQNAMRRGIQSLAICLLHSHVNDEHERQVQRLAEELGWVNLSRSSEVARLIKLVARAETTTLDAYLNPILAGYLNEVWQQFGGVSSCKLRLMTSSGNLVAPAAFRGKDSILSGPAGGVVALGRVAEIAGVHSVIGLDMGGTSTDVSRFEGRVGRRYESRVAGIRVMTPMMDIETVAAGGGSICELTDEGRLMVGPASAGADPGPASYGRGGPLTVTDVNLLLGRIPERRFPFPLDRDAAIARLQEIRQRFDSEASTPSAEAIAEGFLDIAVTHMAEAVRTVSTAQGSDVREMALAGFGGAAGQHLCRLAGTLGIRRILDHPDSGMLSALGMGLARVGRVVSRGIYSPLSDLSQDRIESIVEQLNQEARQLLRPEHSGETEIDFRQECDLRYLGTESSLTLPLEPKSNLLERFHQAHEHTFGYCQPERAAQVVVIRCEATLQPMSPVDDGSAMPTSTSAVAAKPATKPETIAIWHDSQWIEAQLIDRSGMRMGQRVDAPAIIVSKHSTLVIEPGWKAVVIEEGVLCIEPLESSQPDSSSQPASNSLDSGVDASPAGDATARAEQDPVLLEVIARRLQGIADAMGEVLRRTSISVNVKERRDYSCAVFRGDGSLIANAPHVPVHLGAMGHTVRRILSVYPEMSPGDCYLSNDPFRGGSHLPDVTAVTPVFCDGATRGRADFFVASRAHHAEIGGITPGSMPPNAKSLAEEGVLIRDFALARGGVSNRQALRERLASGPFPSRCVEENLADIAAQQAAGAHGARALRELSQTYSTHLIDKIMERLLSVAGDTMRGWIRTLGTEPLRFQDALDDGTKIAVELERIADRLRIDFQTGPVHPGGFNATPAIVTAAVLYVLRSVCGSNLPLCDGVLRDVDINIPSGLLDPPANEDPTKCAAVVAGNVETSQRIVDVLLGALQVAAASQGTMNNVLIGDSTFGYYETIGGGCGATPGHQGADAVHTHMTNTRITDPEVLESRLPLRLHRFAIRRGSGGDGQFRGGDGIIREFEFLKPLVVSLITSRRNDSPYGVAGGQNGKPGKNLLMRQDAAVELPSTITLDVLAGERLIVKTPGGGGWGTIARDTRATGNR